MLSSLWAKTGYYYRRFRAFLGKGFIQQKTKVVTVNEENHCERPIFILGTHRSGTSLLRRVLDSHQNIACPPESQFLKHYQDLLADDTTWNGLSNLGFEREEAIVGLRKGASYFHEAYRRAKDKPRWADKTPQYVFCMDALWTLFGPGAQFVFIIRHPLDVAFSIWNRGWEFGEQNTGDFLVDTCQYVMKSGQRQIAFMKEHTGSCTVIHYDQLVESPQRSLQQLCEYLEEPFDERMLFHADEPHDFGTEDPVARGTSGFKGSYENWRAWSEERQDDALSILKPLIDELGYTTEHARVVSSLREGLKNG